MCVCVCVCVGVSEQEYKYNGEHYMCSSLQSHEFKNRDADMFKACKVPACS
jgi:hypothetical protein